MLDVRRSDVAREKKFEFATKRKTQRRPKGDMDRDGDEGHALFLSAATIASRVASNAFPS